MFRIFFANLLFFTFSYSYPIKWGISPEKIGNIKPYKSCRHIKIYAGNLKNFKANKVLYYFYLNRLYRAELKYKSFYKFLDDVEKIVGITSFGIYDVKTYEKGDTVIKIVHTPFLNKIEFYNKLYYNRKKIIEKCY